MSTASINENNGSVDNNLDELINNKLDNSPEIEFIIFSSNNLVHKT